MENETLKTSRYPRGERISTQKPKVLVSLKTYLEQKSKVAQSNAKKVFVYCPDKLDGLNNLQLETTRLTTQLLHNNFQIKNSIIWYIFSISAFLCYTPVRLNLRPGFAGAVGPAVLVVSVGSIDDGRMFEGQWQR